MPEQPTKTPIEPDIKKAGWIMTGSLLLSRVLGIVRDAIIAGKFGLGEMVDIYSWSFLVPDLIFYLVAGGALSSAFIPVFTEYLSTDREDDAWRIFSSVVTIMSLFLFLAIGTCWIFAEPLAAMLAQGAEPSQVPLVAHLSRIILPAQFAFFIGGIMFGTLYARQVFSVPGLAPNIYNLGIIFGALFLSSFVVPAVSGMSWGALIGAFVGNLLIPILVLRRMKSRFRPAIDLKHEGVRKIFKLMLPVILGLSLPGVFALILKSFVGQFEITGLVGGIEFANKVMQAPLGIFGQSLAIALFPALSQFFAQGKMDAFRSALGKTLRTVLYLGVPCSALLVAVPESVVEILFRWGKFDGDDAAMTYTLLRFLGIGVFAWCLQPVLMRAYFAMQQTVKPIVMGTITTFIFLGLVVGAVAADLPYWSLPLAGSIAAMLLAALLIASIQKDAGDVDIPAVLSTLAKSGIAAVIAGGFALALQQFALPSLTSMGKVGAIIGIVLLFLLFAWAYFLVTMILKMPETRYVRDRLPARFGGKKS